MKFGLFEHMDDSGVPLGQQFEFGSRFSKYAIVTVFTPIISPNTTGRHLGSLPLPAYFWLLSPNEQSAFGSVLSLTRCRCIIPSA